MKAGTLFIILGICGLSLGQNLFSQPVRTEYTEAELVAEISQFSPGDSFYAALRLNPDPHWHVYWINPGDAGLPPELEWELPPEFEAGPLLFPFPEKIPSPPLASFGYSSQTLFPVLITTSSELNSGDTVILRAQADWLVCKEECLPESADLSLRLKVGTSKIVSEWSDNLQQALKNVPQEAPEWQWNAQVNDTTIILHATIPEKIKTGSEFGFFSHAQGVMQNAADQIVEKTDGQLFLRIKRDEVIAHLPDTLTGIVVYTENNVQKAQAISVTTSQTEPAEPLVAAEVVPVDSGFPGGMALALVFAFLGGIILNLMPCVLPVLSLKIFDFIKKAGQSRMLIFSHGLVFTLGVLASFWVLAGMLILLQKGGSQLGWGFQLQSPLFVYILCSFLFLFALSLLGVFELGTIFTRLNVPGGGGNEKSRYAGSFLSGVTATIVATPCTAPFMGSALGYGLTQGSAYNMILFTSLGLGMASPYLLLSAFPGFLKYLPKPGAWMETLKQIMGFFLLATLIWLIWVLGNLTSVNAVTVLAFVLLLLAVSGWILGRWAGLSGGNKSRNIARIVAAVLSISVLWIGGSFIFNHPAPGKPPPSIAKGGIAWETFSEKRFRELQNGGNPFFVNFTADWCLSCKVNERVAFGSAEVQRIFKEKKIVALKADWTARDSVIARILAGFGRNSIPFYLFYSDGSQKPVVLPEILTPGIVIKALQQQNQL